MLSLLPSLPTFFPSHPLFSLSILLLSPHCILSLSIPVPFSLFIICLLPTFCLPYLACVSSLLPFTILPPLFILSFPPLSSLPYPTLPFPPCLCYLRVFLRALINSHGLQFPLPLILPFSFPFILPLPFYLP